MIIFGLITWLFRSLFWTVTLLSRSLQVVVLGAVVIGALYLIFMSP